MLRRTRRHATWPADVWRSEWTHDTLPHSAVVLLRLLPTTAGTLAAKASQGVDAKTVIDVVQTAPGKFNVVVRVSGLDTSSMKAGKLSSMTASLKKQAKAAKAKAASAAPSTADDGSSQPSKADDDEHSTSTSAGD